jgi:enamine deaminase RidA (YjgF/YER057c/UK114 family)
MAEIQRIETSARISRAVIHNGIAYLAGQTSVDRTQDIRVQTRDVLSRIDARLAQVGTDKSRLLTALIMVKNMKDDFAGMNEIWDAWTAPGAAPARASLEANLSNPEVLVEIIVTAAV